MDTMKDCTVYKTVDIIGKKWSLYILFELHKGEKGEKGFNELKRKLKDITPKTLSARLKELEEEGLIQKVIDDSVLPVRCEYSLTTSGEDFISIIRDIKAWGLKWKFSNEVCESSVCRLCDL
ncbi:putative transcriptional regulator [Methanomethylovorans hollandica DSM 15978]|jgi:DNA-binding HxlR family transcriptional regulator|uniref:Putative transcriptional regulator n=2 Tax=Methanomethylovorans hollandica TaxID=101192 RepID=L0KZJ5_METHD|nr:putative transcriptional regulator [Methanomethylovorans hollandica DSM 15978]